MAQDWMEELKGDVQEENEDDEDDVQESSSLGNLETNLRTLAESNNVENVNIMALEDGVNDIDDVDLLEDALAQDTREDALGIYRERLEELGGGFDEDEGDSLDDGEDEGDAQEEKTDGGVESILGETENDEDDVAEEADEESEESPEQDSSESGVDNILDSDDEDNESTSDIVDREPGIQDDDEDDDDVGTKVPGTIEKEDEDDMKSSSGANLDVSDIAPNAMDQSEAAETEPRQGILIWGDPGMGKTHFGYTCPEPVCIIDTEGKGDDIAHKFDGKQVFVWQPEDFDGARESLEEAFNVLEKFKSEADMRGTIVIDSMSIMWDWSQQKYVEFAYPTKDDASEVKFSSNMGSSGESDWQQIKHYHNTQFRQKIIESPYHFCWSQMRGDDYAAVMDGEAQTPPDKPVGEKNNPYKANYILKVEEGPEGFPVGHLQKSALTKYKYVNLKYPTYEKHREVLDAIDKAERGEIELSEVPRECGHDVDLIEGKPAYQEDDE